MIKRLICVAALIGCHCVGAAYAQQLVQTPIPTVTVSSQNTSTGQLGTQAIDGVVDGYPGDYTKEWATVHELAGAWIQLAWTSPQSISAVMLYDRPNLTDQILAGTLSFSDGSTVPVGSLPNAAQGLLVLFAARTVTWVKFTVNSAVGSNIGLAEIQVYSPSGSSPGGLTLGSLTLNPTTVAGGNSTQATLTLSGVAPANGATVLLASSNPSLILLPISVSVQSGQSSVSFSIPTPSVSVSSTAILSAAYGGVSQAVTLTISPPSGGATNVALTATVSDSSENTSTGQLGTKAIDGVIDGYPGDYTKEWATVHQLAGAWIQLNWASPVQVSQVVLWDRPNTTDNVVAGTLTFSDGSSINVGQLPNTATTGWSTTFATKTITWVQFKVTQAVGSNIGLAEFQVFGSGQSLPLDVAAVTLNPATVVGGNTSQGTVTLNGAAPSTGAVVSLSSSNPSVATVPTTVAVPANLTSTTFSVATTSVTTSATSTISASYSGGITQSALLSIVPQTSNSDIALTAAVTDSSENTSTGQLGTKAIDGVIDGYPGDYTKEWATVHQLAGAWIQLNWASPVQVSQVVLWDRPNTTDNVVAGTLTFSDGSSINVGQLPNTATTGWSTTFATKTITWVQFKVTQAVGSNIGLAEFQVFGSASGGMSISGVSVSTTATTATIGWSTSLSASSRVDYGTSSLYGSSVSDSTLVTTHSLTASSLTCNTIYHYQITSTASGGNPVTTADATFTTGPCNVPGAPISDDFTGSTLNKSMWTFYANCCGSVKMSGTDALLVVPSVTNHNIYNANQGVGLLQTVSNVDFDVVTKFDSEVTKGDEEEGIIVQHDSQNFAYFAVYNDGTSPRLLAVVTTAGTASIKYDQPISGAHAPFWLRVTRSGGNWTESWSANGTTYNVGTTFSQTMVVTGVGPVAANSVDAKKDPAPGFTAAVDYFFNLAAPISPTDGGQPAPPNAPVIDIWYGDNQAIGQNGVPQTWVNILGNVSDPAGITSLTYSLNNGPEQSLSMGQTVLRLVDSGDFNAEIAYSDLTPGNNTVRITATDSNFHVSQHTVIVSYAPGTVWLPTYSINWSSAISIQDVAQVVDGKWALQDGGVRTIQTGYDRLIAFGQGNGPTDANGWTHLVGTMEITIHALDCTGYAVGAIVGWTGHTSNDNGVPSTIQPRPGHPFPADFAYTEHGLIIGANSSVAPEATLAQSNTTLSLGVTYIFKFQVTAGNGPGYTHFTFKVWPKGQTEPSDWQLQADEQVTSKGSVVIAAHLGDISVGNIDITPLP